MSVSSRRDDQGAAYIDLPFGGLGSSVLVARRLHAGQGCEVIGLPWLVAFRRGDAVIVVATSTCTTSRYDMIMVPVD